MGILSWLVLGLIGGFIGGKIVNASGQGLLVDIALGIVGAIVGGFPVHRNRRPWHHWPQHLEHVRGDHRLRRGAVGLSCVSGAPLVGKWRKVGSLWSQQTRRHWGTRIPANLKSGTSSVCLWWLLHRLLWRENCRHFRTSRRVRSQAVFSLGDAMEKLVNAEHSSN